MIIVLTVVLIVLLVTLYVMSREGFFSFVVPTTTALVAADFAASEVGVQPPPSNFTGVMQNVRLLAYRRLPKVTLYDDSIALRALIPKAPTSAVLADNLLKMPGLLGKLQQGIRDVQVVRGMMHALVYTGAARPDLDTAMLALLTNKRLVDSEPALTPEQADVVTRLCLEYLSVFGKNDFSYTAEGASMAWGPTREFVVSVFTVDVARAGPFRVEPEDVLPAVKVPASGAMSKYKVTFAAVPRFNEIKYAFPSNLPDASIYVTPNAFKGTVLKPQFKTESPCATPCAECHAAYDCPGACSCPTEVQLAELFPPMVVQNEIELTDTLVGLGQAISNAAAKGKPHLALATLLTHVVVLYRFDNQTTADAMRVLLKVATDELMATQDGTAVAALSELIDYIKIWFLYFGHPNWYLFHSQSWFPDLKLYKRPEGGRYYDIKKFAIQQPARKPAVRKEMAHKRPVMQPPTRIVKQQKIAHKKATQKQRQVSRGPMQAQ